jgi:hypothetical protein
MPPLFRSVLEALEATEAAVYNSLLRAPPLTELGHTPSRRCRCRRRLRGNMAQSSEGKRTERPPCLLPPDADQDQRDRQEVRQDHFDSGLVRDERQEALYAALAGLVCLRAGTRTARDQNR